MAAKSEILLELTGMNFSSLSKEELQSAFRKTLDKGIHGICFSPYLEGQGPGSVITEEQVRQRMEIIRPYTKWVRSFSCTDGNELIPTIAQEYGIKTLVGAWLGKDREKNEKEIANLIAVAQSGHADILAVGNEVMYRKEMSEEELLEYLHRVKNAIPDIPMGYVDAYYEFSKRPRITEACDVILANCYPFWEGCEMDYSLLYMKEMYYRAVIAGNGKNVIITETGWPNTGSPFGGSVPSYENAIKYFINAAKWAAEENIEMFYFSSFDEAWKISDEGDVGAYWGIWDKDGTPKYAR
ncbi:MAG: glycosyl hydrolase [Terrimonas sp.]|nr:glycosyl hydrolase [Terrimonas sp.]